MKNIKFLLVALVAFISACDVEDQYPSKVEVVSYPTIVLKGDSAVSIPVGGTYTDAGATLIDDITGASSDLSAVDVSVVDVNTPGLYMVTYRASNTKGFETVKQRPVGVTNIDPSADISGEYERLGLGIFLNLTEVANGVYYNDNIAGSSLVFPAYMAQLDASTLTVPPQIMPDGSILDCDEETLIISGDTVYFSYVVDNPSNFGPATREFQRVP